MRAVLPALFLLFVAGEVLSETALADEPSPAPPEPALNPAVRPISELPPHIRFKDGEKSVFVDYAAAKDGLVPAYLVNASEDPDYFMPRVSIFIRETRANDGTWYHCDRIPEDFPNLKAVKRGESDIIPPDSFYQCTCRLHSSHGQTRPVRFIALYANGHEAHPSNAGTAVVDADEAVAAVCELPWSGGSRNFDELAVLALGAIELPDRFAAYQRLAIGLLAEFENHPRRVPILKKIAAKAKRLGDLAQYRLAVLGLSIPDPLGDCEAVAMVALACDPCRPRSVALATYLRNYGWGSFPLRTAPRWDEKAVWKLLTMEFNQENQSFRRVVLEVIGNTRIPATQKMAFFERIFTNPKHPLLRDALRVYAFVAGTVVAKESFQAIYESSAYSRADKEFAKAALEAAEQRIKNPHLVE